MKITRKELYQLIDVSLIGIEDYECCKESRENQCKIIKQMIANFRTPNIQEKSK